MRLKIGLALVAAACVVWILCQSVAQVQQTQPGQSVQTGPNGEAMGNLGPAPDITIRQANADGKPLSLSSLKGKVVLVDLWATWCGPCRMSIPGTVALYKKHHGDGLEVVGVALEEDDGSNVRPFAKQYGMTYPVGLPTSADAVRELQQRVGSGGIPLMALVDKKGVIRYVQRGYAPGVEQEIETQVETLLKES